MLTDRHELGILKAIVLKKNFPLFSSQELTAKTLNELIKFDLKKRKDYNVKFAFARVIDHLKKRFLRTCEVRVVKRGGGTKSTVQSKDYAIYHHHFGAIAAKKKIPIEQFFAFKNHSHIFNRHIPRSINSQVLSLWKLNPAFIAQIEAYLARAFLDDFKMANQIKVRKMVMKWARLVGKLGLAQASEKIVGKLGLKGSKVPWTVSEVKEAVLSVRKMLSE